jgi:hypothetical protein
MTEEELRAPIVVTEDMQRPHPHSLLSDESSWYPHKYKAFDAECKTEEQFQSKLYDRIQAGVTTPDFEAEKYIIYQRYRKFLHVLQYYEIKDWVHLVACCIVNANPLIFMSTLIDLYSHVTGQLFSVDPKDNELLWLCLKLRNMESMIVLTRYCYYDKLLYENILINDSYSEMMSKFQALHQLHPSNKRNLVYVLQNNDIEGALKLIENGCEVDCWNNYPMKIVVMNEYLKQNNKLVNAILSQGGRIPLYIFEAQHRARNMANLIMRKLGLMASTQHTQQIKQQQQPLKPVQCQMKEMKEPASIFSSEDDWSDDVTPGTFGNVI